MRPLLLAVLILPFAAPVAAQRAQPVLPFAPRGVDYVETRCSGGIDGRYEQVRVLANGQVQKVSLRSNGVLRARATDVEVHKIWRSLDLARFERRVVRGGLYPPDGISCSLTRRLRDNVHTVEIPQITRNDAAIADLRAVLNDINLLGQRATGAVVRPAEAP